MERENVALCEKARADIVGFEKNGNSLVLTSVDGELKVLMGIRDQIRPGVKEDLSRLKRLGVKNLVMLSGDNQGTVDAVSRELGLTEAHGNMLPEDKAAYIKRLIEEEGQIVAFVGDGVNDSPSLALAHIGIAMGGGTDVAIETSDVVLMNSDFSRLPHALGLAKATSRNMKQNIFIAVSGSVPSGKRVLQRMDEYVHRHVGARRKHSGRHPQWDATFKISVKKVILYKQKLKGVCEMKKATIQLDTLTCPSCVQKIEKATKSLNGVDKESVKILFNSSKLKFDFDPERLSVEEVEKAITALGYDVKKTQVKDK